MRVPGQSPVLDDTMADQRPRSSRNRATSDTEAVANDDLAQATIDTSSLERWPGTYFIGNYSGRISFFAQQTRALNLVLALIRKERIEAGDRVGIVGGGLAGVTAAVALLQKDVEPDLFEQNHTLFRYQKNTRTRHVHPSVNFQDPRAGQRLRHFEKNGLVGRIDVEFAVAERAASRETPGRNGISCE
jgi:hypothetical protein